MDDGGNPLFPRFSEQEMERRQRLMRDMMRSLPVEALIVYGSPLSQGPLHYLSNYLARSPAWLIYPAESTPTLLLHFYNHIPNTKALSIVGDVRWYGESAPAAVAGALKNLGLSRARIGVVGSESTIPYGQFVKLTQALPGATFAGVDRRYNEIRAMRSEEEIGWFRRSAQLTDLTMSALEAGLKPGLTGNDIVAMIHERPLREGGQMGIHFVSSTSMDDPDRFIPWQFPTARPLAVGDIVLTEVTVSYWSYSTQIHRPFAIKREPNALYRRLFDVALEAYDRVAKALKPGSTTEDVLRAASVIEEKGYTVYDSLVHGEGGKGPEIGTVSSQHVKEPFTFKENMVVVIQPNPITTDHRAGLQLGAAAQITQNGAVALHDYPFKFVICR